MNACVFCGQSEGHLGACPIVHKGSRAEMRSWQEGFRSASSKLMATMWVLEHYSPTFQLGYKMGGLHSQQAAIAGN